MNENIASKVLAIAKKNEQEEFLKALQRKVFDSLIRRFEPLKMGKEYCAGLNLFQEKSYEYCRELGSKLGFEISLKKGVIYLLVPKAVKGQKHTPAQKMLYRSNKTIRDNIKSEEASAMEKCKEVLEKLKKGEFLTSSVSDGSYEVKVEVSCEKLTTIFKRVAKDFLLAEGFTSLFIDENKKTWTLGLSDKEC